MLILNDKLTEEGKLLKDSVLKAVSPILYDAYSRQGSSSDIIKILMKTFLELRDPSSFKRLMLRVKNSKTK